MTDKNGKDIRTGDVVEITGAYFNNDNGLYYVEYSPGDPNWTGNYHALHKIGKTGRVSTARYATKSWPIVNYTNDWMKKAEGDIHNKENATIEIRTDINKSYIAEEFSQTEKEYREGAQEEAKRHGEDWFLVKEYREIADFLSCVIKRISA